MNQINATNAQIRLIGLKALMRDLGPYGMIRFLQQFESGYGDYTLERRNWLGNDSVTGLAREIRGAAENG
jgi:hypothetical protein